jgi:1-acyl-sn-glycerol-3-phosphate acyltransferase
MTPIFWLSFLLLLIIFHPIQWVSHRLFGYEAHKRSVELLNRFIVWNIYLVGGRIHFNWKSKVPEGKPYIIVANHQGMYDIPPLIWYLRHLHAKFISKKELGKGIPSISYNLRHGGSVLIDRKDRRQEAFSSDISGRQSFER